MKGGILPSLFLCRGSEPGEELKSRSISPSEKIPAPLFSKPFLHFLRTE
jgi:hypothetical protein